MTSKAKNCIKHLSIMYFLWSLGLIRSKCTRSVGNKINCLFISKATTDCKDIYSLKFPTALVRIMHCLLHGFQSHGYNEFSQL